VAGEQIERRLAAILVADVAGYSRLIGIDTACQIARDRFRLPRLRNLAGFAVSR